MEENKKNKKTGLVVSIILIIILVVALGASIYLLINSKTEIENKDIEISKLNNDVKTLTNQVEDYSKQLAEKVKEVESKNDEMPEMTLELAYGILNKYKVEHLPDAKWYIGKVTLVAHGDNNTYLVAYEEHNLDGYESKVGAIIEYKNGKWVTDLPGFSGTDEEMMRQYNFVNY